MERLVGLEKLKLLSKINPPEMYSDLPNAQKYEGIFIYLLLTMLT